jgi:hypothetical protein
MAFVVPDLYPLTNSPFNSPLENVDIATPLRDTISSVKDLAIKPVQDLAIKPMQLLERKLNSYIRDEIEMRSVKILDIGYIAMLYFAIGIFFTTFYDKLFGEWTIAADSNKSTFRLGLELLGMIWLFGVTTYIVRNVIELIPSPMSYIPLSNPERKFEHRRVRELGSATVFTLILMGTSYHFKNKLEYFYRRITGRAQ